METRGLEPLTPALQRRSGLLRLAERELVSVGLGWPVTVPDRLGPLVRSRCGTGVARQPLMTNPALKRVTAGQLFAAIMQR